MHQSRTTGQPGRAHEGRSRQIVETPHILVVDDSEIKGSALVDLLTGCGYSATWRPSAKAAVKFLATHNVAFAMVDGNLGDYNFGENGLSGGLCKTLTRLGIRFGRLSLEAELIPKSLRGECCVSAAGADFCNTILDFFSKKVPVK